MIAFMPFFCALLAHSAAACGVRCADIALASKGTPKSWSIFAAAFMVSQSEVEPITMPIVALAIQFFPRQALERLAIFLGSLADHLGRQLRRRRRLVPVEGLQVVAHVLLVVGRRADADLVGIRRPEARRV